MKFIDCTFTDCEMSLVKVHKTAFQDVIFTNCKLMGVHFDDCNHILLFFKFNKCQLDLSSFYRLKLSKTSFQDCSLKEVDFSETDLTASIFRQCDLQLAVFDNTILEKADLSTAINYIIDPDKNHIRKAIFSMPDVITLLNKYQIVIRD
ncbi:MAG: pentapeptide repeat-containing protein [Bacteroidetes bacterium]|nr:pentapeptide repeat-containing protein [Bacteroidota bacterium]